MKKVVLICIVLVCVAVLSAGSLSIDMPSPHSSAPDSWNDLTLSTAPTTHVASNPSIKALKPPALTANQLSRRHAYSGPFYASSKSLSKKYHYPGCWEVANIDAENLITFNNIAKACAASYKPCLRCNPPPCNDAS